MAILAALMAVNSLSAQEVSAEQTFAERIVTLLRDSIPEATFAQEPGDPLQINVTGHPEWDEVTYNLHRIYGFCESASADECEDQIGRFIQSASEEAPGLDAANLRIIVRDATYWSYVKQALADKGELPAYKQIGEDLFAILALDSPNSIQIAAPETIAELGLEPDVAWERALGQTLELLSEIPSAQAFEESLHAFDGEAYVGTMLADIAEWSRVSEQVGPDLMITVASDDFVVAGIVPDGEALDGFKQAVAQDCAAAPRCVSPNVYRFRDGGWVIAD